MSFFIRDKYYYAPELISVIKAKKQIYYKKSKYQEIEIFETKPYGKLLVLDNVFQASEADEFVYHDLMVHVPILTHPNPRNVLIIGGGDGGCLREAVKHKNLKKIVMIELDKEVINACKKYFPLDNGAYKDKRVKLIIGDGFNYLKKQKNKFDVIIVDTTDPVMNESASLFTKEFFKNVKKALTKDGLFSIESGIQIFPAHIIKKTCFQGIKDVFKIARIAIADIVTYAGSFAIFYGSKKYDPAEPKPNKFKSKAYNYEYHKACFALPEIIKKTVYK